MAMCRSGLWMLLFVMVGCATRTAAQPALPVWVADGKSEVLHREGVIIPDLSGSYFSTLMRICDWNVAERQTDAEIAEARQHYLGKEMVITPIGAWGRYQVFDLTNLEIRHKGVVLKQPDGRYRILYLQFVWERRNFTAMPYIETVQGQQVLSFRTTVPGTGNADMGFHFVQDAVTGEPLMVDDAAIEKAIAETVPVGWGVWKGGGLDFTNQHYSAPVWQRKDANCCPSGGRIDLDLRLERAVLTVVSVRYQPEFDWGFNSR